jgi:hypothetical protein
MVTADLVADALRAGAELSNSIVRGEDAPSGDGFVGCECSILEANHASSSHGRRPAAKGYTGMKISCRSWRQPAICLIFRDLDMPIHRDAGGI